MAELTSGTRTPDLAVCETALRLAGDVVARASRALAAASREGAEISVARMDRRQVACCDLCHMLAQTEAARAILDHAAAARRKAPDAGPLVEERLAALFVAETAADVQARVLARPAEFGFGSAAEVFALTGAADYQQALALGGGAANVDAAARHLAESGGAGDALLSEDHAVMRDAFRAFADEKVKPIAERVHRHDELVPEELIAELADMGCFGASIPERYGGFQSDARPDNTGMVVVTEELSRASLGAAGSLITRPEILSKALLKGGTEEQKQTWLPLIATGQKMVAVAVTEPDYGSDVAALKVAAARVPGGWRLTGVKTWCTFAGRAELLMVLARTDPDPTRAHKGLSVFIVEKPRFDGHVFTHAQPAVNGAPSGGRIEGRAIPTIGYRGMHSFEVVFEEYFVPQANLIGQGGGEGRGFYLQMEGFAGGRLQTAARALGVMQAAFDDALAYAREREVFGQPLIAYQLTRHKLARMAAAISAIRQMSYKVARLMDEGGGSAEAALVKLFASRSAEWVCREAQQIHGGMGYAEEYAVSRYFLDARVLSIFEGAEETLALRVVARAHLARTLATMDTGA
ncbi:MAG: acyl-CoA dehydrogenase family protein [Planctomycetes bacterium]|nr:acyl-CoA dehydrogenase family protein [Planctomycetota bacterium]